MSTDPADWLDPTTRDLFDAIAALPDRAAAERFFRDLCTLRELHDMAQRWQVVQLLDRAATTPRSRARPAPARPRSPGSRSGCTTAPAATPSTRPRRRRRRTRPDELVQRARYRRPVAGCGSPVPNKGRLLEPTIALLRDAGLVFEDGTRALVAHAENFPLDILSVRTEDVVEFVGDGVADLGITGTNLLPEAGAELPVLLELGYGRCRLEAAVPNDSPARSLADLAGTRLATSHPNSARRFFDEMRHRRWRSCRSAAPWRWRHAWASPTASSTSCRPARRWS